LGTAGPGKQGGRPLQQKIGNAANQGTSYFCVRVCFMKTLILFFFFSFCLPGQLYVFGILALLSDLDMICGNTGAVAAGAVLVCGASRCFFYFCSFVSV
jgi:hypothetical protein